LGAIAGSLAGGFGLLPILTATGAWQFVVITLSALALAALAMKPRAPRFSSLGVLATGGASAALVLFSLGPTAAWRHSGVGVGRSELNAPTLNATIQVENKWRRYTVWQDDGVESSVAILASHGVSFIVNGKSDGNVRTDAGTQVMGGLI